MASLAAEWQKAWTMLEQQNNEWQNVILPKNMLEHRNFDSLEFTVSKKFNVLFIVVGFVVVFGA